jgi:hypothetical protein
VISKRTLFIAVAQFLLLSLAVETAHGFEKLPVIYVRVLIDAAPLRTGLDTSRQAVEDGVADALTRYLTDHFGFIDWRPLLRTDGNTVTCLTLKVIADTTTRTDVDPALHIQYHAHISGGDDRALTDLNSLLRSTAPLVFSEARSLAIVYPSNSLPPTHDAEAIKRQIELVARQHFDVTAFRGMMHETFTRGIPLTTKIGVRADAMRITIPFAAHQLKVSDDSQFLVTFTQSKVNAAARISENGSLNLQKSGLAGDHTIQCIVLKLQFPGFDRDRFDPILVTIADLAMRIEVFMWKYVPEPSLRTDGRLFTDI